MTRGMRLSAKSVTPGELNLHLARHNHLSASIDPDTPAASRVCSGSVSGAAPGAAGARSKGLPEAASANFATHMSLST
jgi:hypothetical protein